MSSGAWGELCSICLRWLEFLGMNGIDVSDMVRLAILSWRRWFS